MKAVDIGDTYTNSLLQPGIIMHCDDFFTCYLCLPPASCKVDYEHY